MLDKKSEFNKKEEINKTELEIIRVKAGDPDTIEEEMIKILAKILFEGFMSQEAKRSKTTQETETTLETDQIQ